MLGSILSTTSSRGPISRRRRPTSRSNCWGSWWMLISSCFKDPDSMAMDPAGVRIQEPTEIFNAKLGCVSNVLKSYNAKLGDERKPSDEANSASNRLVHAHTGSFD